MTGSVAILRPGLHTTVQDLGRWGAQASGVSVAGPMDPWSHRLANLLVGNASDDALLELTLVGPELQFDDERWVAVVGGEFSVSIDGRAVRAAPPWRVEPGSRMQVGTRTRGARAYLAVAGGIDVPLVLGSRATHVTSGLGGLDGRALKAGDRLSLGAVDEERRRRVDRLPGRPLGASLAGTALAHATRCLAPGETTRLRVLPGPQLDRFSPAALDALHSAPYRVLPDSNRMGFRLEGPLLAHADDREPWSDATPFGVVQVPRSGQPILLMADRQTTGGYPKIATVISADAGLAGQVAPGDFLRFEVCDEGAALAVLAASERAFREFASLVS
jgi:antagonist of KipI